MNMITEAEWQEWNEAQQAATIAGLVGNDFKAAVNILNRYLEDRAPEDLRGEVIAFRGTLYQEHGELERAKNDYLEAWHLAAEDYARFELEDTLAEISKKLDDAQEADRWYSTALATGATDPRAAGGGFLLRFLQFRGQHGLSDHERQLAETMIIHGWQLLQVEGEPVLHDLEEAAGRLLEAQQGPFSAHRPPTPGVDPES